MNHPTLEIHKPGMRSAIQFLLVTIMAVWPVSSVQADASGTIVYTKRFDGDNVVLEVDWTYVRATPSLNFGAPRVIWSGAGAPEGMAGSDGLFYTPAGELVVGNWQSSSFWKLDPDQTDVVIDGPAGDALAFHSLLHPNTQDFLATNAFGQITCNNGTLGCFGVYDHTPLTTSMICGAPLESASNDLLQPVTFIADENLNMFTIFSDGRDCSGCPGGSGIQFGGGGFASFDLDTTTSSNCSANMTMTRLIPQEISAAHSISWDPFLSDANNSQDPHSDFILFANSRVSHVRVDDPGTPGATAQVVSTVNMATEASCASLLPDGMNEFDQGAVTGKGIALVGDEATGQVALIDYSENNNGTILDPGDMRCVTALLADGIDDIAPLTGLGAKSFGGPGFSINAGMNDAWVSDGAPFQGFFFTVFPDLKLFFLSWFTFDSVVPVAGSATFGARDQRWITASGFYNGASVSLNVELTSGGIFNGSVPQATQTPGYGTITIVFISCNEARLTYNFPSLGLSGEITLTRVVNDNVALCEMLSGS